jgi:hypothetical protein
MEGFTTLAATASQPPKRLPELNKRTSTIQGNEEEEEEKEKKRNEEERIVTA